MNKINKIVLVAGGNFTVGSNCTEIMMDKNSIFNGEKEERTFSIYVSSSLPKIIVNGKHVVYVES